MAVRSKLLDRMTAKSAALAHKKNLVAKLSVSKKAAPAEAVPSDGDRSPAPLAIATLAAASPVAATSLPRFATVEGDGVVPLYVAGQRSPQHLAIAMRKLADACLDAAQYRTRNVVLLWPGKLDCLPLAPTLASIALWANGYKRGLRALFYPATQHSFYPLNHIKADRDALHEIVNRVSESSGNGVNPEVKESCQPKDLLMFALNSLGSEAKAAKLRPGLAELFPHFYLATGDKQELRRQNYQDEFLTQLITRLSCRGHTAALRKDTLPYLGDPRTAPDAIFSLSHQITKKDMTGALRNIKEVGAPEMILVDATQAAFRRTEDLRKRIIAFLRIVDEVFGSVAPGVLVVTDDPQQMAQLNAGMGREVDAGKLRCFRTTQGICHPGHNNGLESLPPSEIPGDKGRLEFKVEVTDKESAKLTDQAYRYRGQMQEFPEAAVALGEASAFLRKMANLPSTPELLRAWLDDSLADQQQRRGYDWLSYRNKLAQAMAGSLPSELQGKLNLWLTHADQVLESYERATPLALTMANRIADYRKKKYNTLVVLASPFYVRLAEHFLLGSGALDADSSAGAHKTQSTIRLITGRSLKEEIQKGWATRLVLGFVNPDILRRIMTDRHIPMHVDFLLTQSTATSVYYSLKPVLDFTEFAPYHARVRCILDQLSRVNLEGGGVLPPLDWEPHSFPATLPSGDTQQEGYNRDMVKLSLEDGRKLIRGQHSVEFVYDPASLESHPDLGFRLTHSNRLQVGDRIFVMSGALHEMVESIFRSAGVKLSSGDKLESLLRLYHKLVLDKVKERYPGHVMDRVRGLRAALVRAHPEMSDEFTNIRYWIALDDSPDTPYEQLMPQAPRKLEHFRVFMEALGFDEHQIKLFWEGAIRQVRRTRIADGRYFGDQYSRALFDPGAAAAYGKVPQESLRLLRERALEDIYEVTAIAPLAASTQGEIQ